MSVESCLYISRAIGNNFCQKVHIFGLIIDMSVSVPYISIFQSSCQSSKSVQSSAHGVDIRNSRVQLQIYIAYLLWKISITNLHENRGRLDDTLSRYVLSNSLQTSDFRLPCILPNIGMLRSQVLEVFLDRLLG